MICVFDKCHSTADEFGACPEHRNAALNVMHGRPPFLSMGQVDTRLRVLHAKLIERGFESRLGPDNGVPLATHLAVPPLKYSVDYGMETGYQIRYGDAQTLVTKEADAVVLFLEGARLRG